jgi:uncharacterized protein (DUF1015 family)
VYERAAANFNRLVASGALRRDPEESFYVYRLEAAPFQQIGLVFSASMEAYQSGRIKRHEHTRPDKELDRTRHIEALGAQTGPAMLAYPHAPEVDHILAEATLSEPDTIATADDGVRHTIWTLSQRHLIDQLTKAFEALPALYIADGHHRIAAAERVVMNRRASPTSKDAAAAGDGFLAVAFAHHSMRILDYNRVVTDLGNLSEREFLDSVRRSFDVSEARGPVRPQARGEFGLHLPGRWFQLRVHQASLPANDPAARLDVRVLSDRLLGPILSITDIQRDPRIEFVGGARGLHELERRVATGMAAAFALYPTEMADLMAVADGGSIMPPKSTWFEPKLADGLVSYPLD